MEKGRGIAPAFFTLPLDARDARPYNHVWMLRKGYIQQQIEGLAQSLAVLMGMDAQDKEAALQQMRLATRDLTGLDLDMLLTLSDESLLGMFAGGDRTRTAGNAYVAARLLVERARRDPAIARRGVRKAALLFSEALVLERALHDDERVAEWEELLALVPEKTPLLLEKISVARQEVELTRRDRETPPPDGGT